MVTAYITNASEFQAINNYPPGEYVLANDIDLSGVVWTPLYLSGSIDFNGKTISNLSLNMPNQDYVGLFEYIAGTITGIVYLENFNIVGHSYVGGLAGAINTDNITECYFSGTVTASGIVDENSAGVVGCLFGQCQRGLVSKCYAIGNILGDASYVGGLIGLVGANVTVQQCWAKVNIVGDYGVGGLFGTLLPGVTIENSFACGELSGQISVGGLIGYITSLATINNCYAASIVSGTDAGGLIGKVSDLQDLTLSSSYYDSQVSGQSDNDGRGVPKLTAEMKRQLTYVDWDFETIWGINSGVNDGYPFLSAIHGGFACDPPVLSGPAQATSAKCPITFQCPTPLGTNPDWLLHFKVQVYVDEAMTTLISEIDTTTSPLLFKISTDNATLQAFPVAGIPPVQYSCMVQAMAELGPRSQVWIKLSVGAEDA